MSKYGKLPADARPYVAEVTDALQRLSKTYKLRLDVYPIVADIFGVSESYCQQLTIKKRREEAKNRAESGVSGEAERPSGDAPAAPAPDSGVVWRTTAPGSGDDDCRPPKRW